jgi:glucose/arabinose dehydrogenase
VIARRTFLAGVLALALLATGALGAGGAAAATVPSGFQSEVAFSKLTEPTNFRFAPDGRLFVAQKNGEIKVFPVGSGPTTTPETFADLRKPVYDFHDRGLLGLALDPKFDEGQPYVYALYTFDHELGKPFTAPYYPRWGEAAKNYEGEDCNDPKFGCVVSGRLVRLRVAPGTNHAAPSAAEPVEEPLIEDWCQQYPSHSVGDLQFGPEGALFVGGGDGAAYENFTDWGQSEFGNPCNDPPEKLDPATELQLAEGGSLRSQSVLRPNGQVTLDGTLLRVDPETGKGWPGNPFAASSNENAQRIVAFGFRNPFRFTIDRATNELFVGNVGNVNYEEIDRFPIGATTAYNSGWPCYEGNEVNLAFQTYKLAACERLYKAPGSTSTPFFTYNHKAPVAGDNCPRDFGSAISGSAFYEGSSYPPEYDHAFFFADSVRQCIFVMPANASGEPDPSRVSLFLSEGGEYQYPGVDLEQGPGGNIYYAGLGTGAIYRIGYDKDSPKPVPRPA